MTNDRSQGRHQRAEEDSVAHNSSTITGNRALQIEEPLIFEQGAKGRSGVDLPAPTDESTATLGGLERDKPIGLPGLSEPEVVRHYTRLSRNNYAIDIGFYPLGSCTMKHNPRLNERLSRLPGLADIHPLQPESTVQGGLALIEQVSNWLKILTGFPAVAMSPAAGAQGELCGLMTIRTHLMARGDPRTVVLIPDSAHGTNPATAAMCGYRIESVPSNRRGRVDLNELQARLGPDIAALMLTNPNTCGLFEEEIIEIAAAVHNSGALFYCDGANFNALVGKVRPADLGIDIMHLNLHKTFSTPHGGGGPGAGPVAVNKKLSDYLPTPTVIFDKSGYHLKNLQHSIGKVHSFMGNYGVLLRAYVYILAIGKKGLRNVSRKAVLNANYLKHLLMKNYNIPHPDGTMHEFVISAEHQKNQGFKALDIAKNLLDFGFHAPTVYFPTNIPESIMIEPTETETKETLDLFAEAMKYLDDNINRKLDYFKEAPYHTPVRRLNEAKANRELDIKWKYEI